jgi:acyl-CoA thioesterase-2
MINRESLRERLVLHEIDGVRTGHPVAGFDQRVFGGQLLAQVLLAAGAHAPADRVIESVHLYFLRPGRSVGAIAYSVRVVRHGRRRTVLEVRAVQGERELVTALVSVGPGDVPVAVAAPSSVPHSVPEPETLPDVTARRTGGYPPDGVRLPPLGDWRTASRPLDVRPVDQPDPSGCRRLWLRAEPADGADGHLQRAILAFASDRSLLPVIARARGEAPGLHRPAVSVDHAMWFHAEPRAGDWYLYAQYCPVAGERSGLACGVLSDRDGRVVASVAQHGVIVD